MKRSTSVAARALPGAADAARLRAALHAALSGGGAGPLEQNQLGMQRLNAEVALELAAGAGLEWLLPINAEEALYVDPDALAERRAEEVDHAASLLVGADGAQRRLGRDPTLLTTKVGGHARPSGRAES